MIYFYLLVNSLVFFLIGKWLGENKARIARQKLEEVRELGLEHFKDAILQGNFRTYCVDCMQDNTRRVKVSLKKLQKNAY